MIDLGRSDDHMAQVFRKSTQWSARGVGNIPLCRGVDSVRSAGISALSRRVPPLGLCPSGKSPVRDRRFRRLSSGAPLDEIPTQIAGACAPLPPIARPFGRRPPSAFGRPPGSQMVALSPHVASLEGSRIGEAAGSPYRDHGDLRSIDIRTARINLLHLRGK